jgi:hypothetical protein
MEMYADPTARGGVLETEGTLDVKFRKKDVIATAHRLDDKLRALDQELAALEGMAPGDASSVSAGVAGSAPAASASIRTKESIQKEIRARESLLFPTYHQVATQFADLHDTPGRMRAKHCLDGIVPWERAREVFYWKLQRRIKECAWVKRITAVLDEVAPRAGTAIVAGGESWREARTLLHGWLKAAAGKSAPADLLQNDQAWFQIASAQESSIEASIAAFKNERLLSRMKELIAATEQNAGSSSNPTDGDVTVGGLAGIISALSAEQRAALKKAFA